MDPSWNIADLLRRLADRGRHPAIIAFGEDRAETWDSATVAHEARAMASGLRDNGIDTGNPVALWGPNSPTWVVSALAVMATGGVLVPIDDLADATQAEAVLARSGARVVLTTARHAEESSDMLHKRAANVVLTDYSDYAPQAPTTWLSPPRGHDQNLPAPSEDMPAALFWTSGTTGSPKAFFLTYRNIGSNIEALQQLAIVGSSDHALVPLPLHHAYPFIVGMLTTLTLGATIVLPGGTTGPLLLRALREGEVTTIIGVPRLYETLVAGIDARVAALGKPAHAAWRMLVHLANLIRRSSGMGLGYLMFAPVRKQFAPRLKLLVSGGARLERETEEELETLGWTVLSGYGLAETASLFTGNRPNDRRPGSAGHPIADGRVRIASPDDQGIGEIELHGSSITTEYVDNPEANRATFTADGWFRTGDLGFLDRDGFLFVTGRAKEILVLGGGRKVSPEDLERLYGGAPEISEIAVLEDNGALVALVRPDAAKLRDRGATSLRDGVRVILGETAQALPSYQRLSGFALTGQPLPRTRLGKYRRFLLPELYRRASAGAPVRTAHALAPEDHALLRDPTASAIWALLHERYPDQMIDLDVDFNLDLNLDSFGWMEFAVTLQDRFEVSLTEADIASIGTVRELLRRVIERRTQAQPPSSEERVVALDVERWLAPTGIFLTALGAALHMLNWLVMRSLFRLRTTGVENLPASAPFVIVSNHVSDLDGLVIAAALPVSRSRELYWAGDLARLFSNSLSRLFCRALHVFPVDARHPSAALESASQVLKANHVLVWFPEAWRSPNGRLQRFLPGIGQLLLHTDVPAIPAYICGAFEAMPRGRRLPSFRRVTVSFGCPEPVAVLRAEGAGSMDEEKIADALRQRVAALAPASGTVGDDVD